MFELFLISDESSFFLLIEVELIAFMFLKQEAGFDLLAEIRESNFADFNLESAVMEFHFNCALLFLLIHF